MYPGRPTKYPFANDDAPYFDMHVCDWVAEVNQEVHGRREIWAVENSTYPEPEPWHRSHFKAVPNEQFDRWDDIDLCSVVSSSATMSDIPGTGRTLGILLSRLGRSLESMISEWAKQGCNPDAIAESLRYWYWEQRPRGENETLKLCRKLKNCLLGGISSTKMLALESLASLAIEFPSLRKGCRQLLVSEKLEKLIESAESPFETIDDHLYFYALAKFLIRILHAGKAVDDGNAKTCAKYPACEVCRTFFDLSVLAQKYNRGVDLTSRLKNLRKMVFGRIPGHHDIVTFTSFDYMHGAESFGYESTNHRSNANGSGDYTPGDSSRAEFTLFDVKERLKILEESVLKKTRMMVKFRSSSFHNDWPSTTHWQFRYMDVTTVSVVEHPYGRNGSMPVHQFGDRRFNRRY